VAGGGGGGRGGERGGDAQMKTKNALHSSDTALFDTTQTLVHNMRI